MKKPNTASEIVGKLERIAKRLPNIRAGRSSENDTSAQKTGCKCRIPGCKGDIVETFSLAFDSRTGPPIYGPAGKDQYRTVSNGFHCNECGVKYNFAKRGHQKSSG